MKTIGELKDKLKTFTENKDGGPELDSMICCFVNMAEKKLSRKISNLKKDYLMSCDEQAVEACQQSVDLPSDIKNTKIKSVMFNTGKECCKLTRGDYDCIYTEKGSPVNYVFFNKKDEGPKLYLSPLPKSAGTLTIIYERTPEAIDENASDDTSLNYPEECDFIFEYVLGMIYQMEKNPLLPLAVSQRNESEEDILESLSDQFTDSSECEVESDSSWEGYFESC